jgi:hypothetical protein
MSGPSSSIFARTDIAALRADRLTIAAALYFPTVNLSDHFLLGQLMAAEAEVAQTLRVFLRPTYIFPYAPSDADVATYAKDAAGVAIPWVEEPGYDYGPDFFSGDRWGYLATRQRPIISVTSIEMAYPAPTQGIYKIPTDWIRLDKKYGTIRLVPATSAFIAPLGAYIMSALGGGSTIPQMIQVRYTAGLQNVREDPTWAGLVDVIYKLAVCKIIESAYLPQSGSISADGLSMSQSLDTSKYRDLVRDTLVGPPGVNGGLKARIHGISMTTLGTLT